MLTRGPIPVARNRLEKIVEMACAEKIDSTVANLAEARMRENQIFLRIPYPYRDEMPYPAASPSTLPVNPQSMTSPISRYPCAANAPAATSSAVAGMGTQKDALIITATRTVYL